MRNKAILTIIILASVLATCYSQKEDYGLSYKVIFPKNLEDGPFSDLWDTEDFSLGAQLAFRKPFNNWFTLEVPIRVGSVEVVRPDDDSRFIERNFVGLDAIGIAGIDPIINPFGPYAFVGIGGDYQGAVDDYNLYFPAGFGVNIKLVKELLLNAEFQRRTSIDSDNSHYQVSLGFIANLNLPPEEEKPLDLEIPEMDTDGDGIPDAEDACPGVAGPAIFKGCPDRDNDGIIDSKDACPDEAGPLATDGCPVKNPGGGIGDIIDSDGDGVSDDNDNCPNEAGFKRFFGCPDTDGDDVSDDKDACPGIVGLPKFSGCPDTDGDGITDGSDNCPTVAGKPEYNGCPNPPAPPAPTTTVPSTTVPSTSAPSTSGPIVSTATTSILADVTQNVQFETSRATLRASSYEALDKVVAIMKEYPSYNLEVAGHTDSIGSSAGNQKLSENRAKSCRDYLVRKGVSTSRIKYIGYGEKQPIADNRYRDGREKNRRVEFRLTY